MPAELIESLWAEARAHDGGRPQAIVALISIRGLSLALPDRAAKPLFGRAPMREILRDINLDIEGGERLGIVGESGSGKTTLGRTLLRLYEPTAGTDPFRRAGHYASARA